MYFRSGKLAYLSERARGGLPASLLALGESEELAFLLDYRDGLAHTVRPASSAAQFAPVDRFVDASGRTVLVGAGARDADELAAIALASFDLVTRALPGTVEFCRRTLPAVDVSPKG
jgi:hypothetical protein